MTKKSILIFSTSYLPYIGGAETAIRGITDQLEDFEFDLITARRDENLATRERIGNINVFRVGKGKWIDKILLPIRGLKKAASLHSNKKYDLVFASMASHGGLTAQRFKKLFPEVPLLLNLQEGRDFKRFNFIKAYFFKQIVKSADFIVAISDHLKKIAIKTGFNIKKIHIIPNGVDMVSFGHDFSYGELSELSDHLGIKPDEKIIISVSRLTHKNAIDDLIKATAILTKSSSLNKYRLVLVGDGEDKKRLTELARDLNIIDNVIFVGPLEHQRVAKYLRIADVFVRPSRSEGLGSAFLESMAAGTPVIGTPVGGIPDFLKDGETGLFCNVGDPQSIAEKVELMINDRNLQNHIIKEGYKMVVENYDWGKIADDYQEVFKALIKSN